MLEEQAERLIQVIGFGIAGICSGIVSIAIILLSKRK